MRNLASKKYGLDMLEPHLPSAIRTLEQVLGGREGGREGWWAGGWVGGQAGIIHTYVNWGGLQCGDLTRAQWMIAWRKGRVEYYSVSYRIFFKQRGDPPPTGKQYLLAMF